MKLINSSVELIKEPNIFKKIELAGRTCYKSEDKITEDSATLFVGRIIKREHLAMIEHAHMIFMAYVPFGLYKYNYERLKQLEGKFNNLTAVEGNDGNYRVLLSGNLRGLLDKKVILMETEEENNKIVDIHFYPNWDANGLYDLHFTKISDEEFNKLPHLQKEELVHKYTTMRFICDRGVSHELVRHRPFSFAQESTRYVKYNNNNMQFIYPADYENWDVETKQAFEIALNMSESYYVNLMERGLSAQQARAVLPNAIKTEVVVTGNDPEWQHFFGLRCDGAAHPDMRMVANKAKELYVGEYGEVRA